MGDNQQLLNLLSLPNVLLDPSKQQQAVTQLCRLMNTDSDEPQIVQPSIKLLSSHQPLTRIAAMTLVQRHVGRNPDIMPQATNALLKCAVDPNPAVRRAAVSTLARMPESADITLPVVSAALRDPHPSVQRAAVVACRVFPKTNPHCHIDHVDELYRLIRSDDALLVHACLMTLDVILEAEGGIVINRAMVRHLSSRSRSLPDAVLMDVLRLLSRYQPGSDDERLSVMNRLDWLLASPRPHLIEAALDLFFHLCSGQLSHLRGDAVSRAAASLCSPGDSPPEWRWAVLELVKRLGPEHHDAFCPYYRYFVPRPTDGTTLSVGLVRFLWRLAGPGSAPAVARELTTCLSAQPLQEPAVRALLRLGRRRPELAAAVVEPLCRLARSPDGGGGGGGRGGGGGGRGGGGSNSSSGSGSGIGGGGDGGSGGLSGAALVAGALNAADLAPLPAAARRRLLSALLSTDLAVLPAHALCRLLSALGRWGGALPTVPARLRQLTHCDNPGSVSYTCAENGALGYNTVTVAGVGVSGGGSGGAGDKSVLRDPAVRRALLEATARVFLQRPAELQLTLGVLLERSVAEGGELAAAAARLYAALEITGGRGLMDGTGAEGEERRESEGGGESEQGAVSVPVAPS